MICFDTGPLIWGVQGKARKGQEHMVERTRRYIRHLSEQKERIMVPSPVAGEYLVKFDNDAREEQSRLIEQSFFVPALDLPSATLAAKLERDCRPVAGNESNRKPSRQQLRVDAQVVAIAIVNQADKIITNDAQHLRVLARGRISVEEVPVIADQLLLSCPDTES